MKFITTLFATALLLSSNTNADTLTNKEKVFKLVENYALATACRTTFEDTKESTVNEKNRIGTDNVFLGINKYFVLWGGFDRCDIAATGENYTYNLTEVEYSESANRYIIKQKNVIEEVIGEDFFSLINLDSFKQIDDYTYEIYINMFTDKDIDPKTEKLKRDAQFGYYRMILTQDYSTGSDNAFKVIEKYKIGK